MTTICIISANLTSWSKIVWQKHKPMKQKCLGFLFLALSNWLTAQTVQLSLPEVIANDGETIILPLTVSDFDSIVSLQLSINWDTDVATFDSFTLGELPLLAIGDFQSDQGELRLSWFDNTGDGRTLADDAVIAYLHFTAMGSPGDFTTLPFTDNPLEIQIFKATGVSGIFEPVDLIQDEGRISIAAPLGFSIEVQNVSCFGLEDGTADVSLTVNTDDYTIAWQGPNGFEAATYSLEGLSGGDYSLVIRDLGGGEIFDYSFTLTEAIAPLSISNIELTNPDCNESNGAIFVEVQGGQSPYFYLLNEINSTTGQFSNLGAGSYSLLVIDENECITNETISIASPNAPVIDLPDSLQLCNESIVLAPEAIGDYEWSTGATTDSIIITEAGLYSLTVTNMEDCISTNSVLVATGAPPTAILEIDFPEICPNDSLELMVSGGDFYIWLDSTNSLSADNIPNPLAFPDTTTTFVVAVSNNCGSDTLSFNVEVYDILATAGQDTCIGPGTELQLQASGGIFYEWTTNNQGLSAIDVPNPTASPEDSITYTVIITDINACKTVDDITVLVANNPADIITPYNLISPNADGKNDDLDFDEISKFGDNSLKVYNRWGDLVYQKRNYQGDEERFDGTYNGELLPAGNYFYVLAFRQGSIKQTLTIIRE